MSKNVITLFVAISLLFVGYAFKDLNNSKSMLHR